MDIENQAAADMSANAVRTAVAPARMKLKSIYTIECRDRSGELKWSEQVENLVVNTGLDDALDKYFKGAAYTASHFVGLVSGTPTIAAADTMAGHAGWTEITAYTEAARPTLTLGAVAGQVVNNAAAKAQFSVNANGTVIGGAFVTTNNTKGGITGTLYGAAAFTVGNKTADNGDTINVQVDLSFAAV